MTDQVKMIDVDTLQDWIEADKAVIVDVREHDEWLNHHIAGATLLPLSAFDPAKIPAIPEGKKLVLHCRSAQRCGVAAAKLVDSGYKGEINRLAGGINAWIAAGAPVE